MILAGDVGGTKVRVALFKEKKGITCIDEEKFASSKFPTLSALLKTFLSHESRKNISAACFGIAGPIRNGVCKATNLPWEISAKVLEKDLNIPKVDLINDLEANAWGLRCLSSQEFATINVGQVIEGNQALISPGTGLGEAGIYWDGRTHHPFSSEGGHCDFSPVTEEQIDLLHYLRQQFRHVSFERLLSGPGLHSLYRFLIDTKREKEESSIASLMRQNAPQHVITEKGISGECQACVRACRLFASVLGSEAGNLALKVLAMGGIFIGGGIVPHILPFLKEDQFMKAFADKGRLSAILSKIPVKVVLNEKTALLGAAQFARENR